MKSAIMFSVSLLALAVFAQERKPEPFDVKAHYTKYEYRIAMRDGVHLFTSVYVPKDTSHPYPFLMTRTPNGGTSLRVGERMQAGANHMLMTIRVLASTLFHVP